jgi:hypothetical protein
MICRREVVNRRSREPRALVRPASPALCTSSRAHLAVRSSCHLLLIRPAATHISEIVKLTNISHLPKTSYLCIYGSFPALQHMFRERCKTSLKSPIQTQGKFDDDFTNLSKSHALGLSEVCAFPVHTSNSMK